MGEHVINFVEGDGISIQASESVDSEQWDVEIASTVTGAAADAADVSIDDAGGYYTATDVEGALQELGATPPGDPAADTKVWMPLTTTITGGDDVLVFDADHSLIPTLIPL
jgi:hypothetical protein